MKSHARILLTALVGVSIASSCKKEEPEVDDGGGGGGPVATPYALQIPSNLPPMVIPADNPMTVEGVTLGRFLFYEERLSADNSMSCASCHAPAFAFTDSSRAVSTGIDGIAGTRSAMALINLGWGQSFFWDGRAATLEEQVLQPVINTIAYFFHEKAWERIQARRQAAAADPAVPAGMTA